jgi:hypothetical protein
MTEPHSQRKASESNPAEKVSGRRGFLGGVLASGAVAASTAASLGASPAHAAGPANPTPHTP